MSATSSATQAQETLKDLLQEYSGWTNADPSVYFVQEVAQSERGPGDGQPAELYIWEPTSGPLNAFDAEYSHYDERRTVEIWIYTLEGGKIGTENTEYQSDIVDFLGEYANDNASNTEWNRIRPRNVDDRRSELMARNTNHHISSVEVELQNHRSIP